MILSPFADRFFSFDDIFWEILERGQGLELRTLHRTFSGGVRILSLGQMPSWMSPWQGVNFMPLVGFPWLQSWHCWIMALPWKTSPMWWAMVNSTKLTSKMKGLHLGSQWQLVVSSYNVPTKSHRASKYEFLYKAIQQQPQLLKRRWWSTLAFLKNLAWSTNVGIT